MKIIETPQAMQAQAMQWRTQGDTVGFVPTMGALHDGHLALAHVARAACDRFVASVFVNPLQFGAHEDFGPYPRPFERDCALLEAAGCDVLFAPCGETMYGTAHLSGHPDEHPGAASRGPEFLTYVEVDKLGEVWEGVLRPGHLRGVATVVAKLFNIVQPSRAYFGEKDFQQLKVIERMVHDLNFPIKVEAVPTVREADGLAMSSRNAYLSPDERRAAPALHQALAICAELARRGERDVTKLGEAMQQVCDAQPLIKVQYIAVVDPDTLSPLGQLNGPARALIAARVGATRLIDNVPIL